jgi:CheY-like chemotaxis protein
MNKPAIVSRRILVVDDEPFVSDAVKMMLTFDGHKVDTASSGQEALALFEKGKYDLIITDYAMPVMKGDELAMTIKARTPDQPIVLITAYAEMLKASRHPLSGVDFVISKPFLLENLRDAINRATSASAQTEAKG